MRSGAAAAGDRRAVGDRRPRRGQGPGRLRARAEALAAQQSRPPAAPSVAEPSGTHRGGVVGVARAAVDGQGRDLARRPEAERRRPAEMAAYNELLKLAAEITERQSPASAAAVAVGGRTGNQGSIGALDRSAAAAADNYEIATRRRRNRQTPRRRTRLGASRRWPADRRAREKQRELARARAAMPAEELKRQLERLTKEQEQLRREAEQLAQQMQREGQGARRPRTARAERQQQSGQQSWAAAGRSQAGQQAGSRAARPAGRGGQQGQQPRPAVSPAAGRQP